LALTGSDSGPLAAAGALSLLVGALMVRATRREAGQSFA
jgi:LPXTG-motif cell wall-anchored protein